MSAEGKGPTAINDGGLRSAPQSTVPVAHEVSRTFVVEDEAEIRDLIALHLRREGHEVDVAGSVEEALPMLERGDYGLVVLDWMLPGASGIDLTRRLRSRKDRSDLAILMITARSEASDIVEGLEAGADDYLSKPFEPQVLLARVRALLRRNRRQMPTDADPAAGQIKAGALHINTETYEVKIEGEPVALTPSEFKLLVALLSNRGRVLTRDSLIGYVQGEGVSVVGRTVDTHIFGLRKKLGPSADLIETVRGIGYRVKPAGEI